MNRDRDLLDRLVDEVLGSKKYRGVSADLVRAIGGREIARRPTLKEALKATRNKLHQVSGAYLEGRESYPTWLADLRQASQSDDRAALLRTCRQLMSYHASTRERLPILDQFYPTLLSDLAPIHSVLDLACGLHPLAIPWMPLAEDAEYYACDIYQPMIDFLNAWLALIPLRGKAEVRDVIQSCPTQPVDVAFVLKTIPCLEQVDTTIGRRLLHTIHARCLLVSFPVHSLGGRSKGMIAHYEAHFRDLVGDEAWEVERFEFATELVFRVYKHAIMDA